MDLEEASRARMLMIERLLASRLFRLSSAEVATACHDMFNARVTQSRIVIYVNTEISTNKDINVGQQ
jgi:hypothetical protein